MDVISPLFSLLFRGFLVVLPLTTGWLAFRRLTLSRSSNAWFYGVTCLFAAVTSAGLLPWALGLADVNWVFLLFSPFCPAIWIGVVMLCDVSPRKTYESDIIAVTEPAFISRQQVPPLVLENPDWPGSPIPVFCHNSPANSEAGLALVSKQKVEETTKSLLSVARDMRGNKDTESRRPKLLSPPDISHLPFIKRSNTA